MIANIAMGGAILGVLGLIGILFYAISDDEIKSVKKN